MPKFVLEPVAGPEAERLFPRSKATPAPAPTPRQPPATSPAAARRTFVLEPVQETEAATLLPRRETPAAPAGGPADLSREPSIVPARPPSTDPRRVAQEQAFGEEMARTPLPRPEYEKKRELLDKLLHKAPTAMLTVAAPYTGIMFETIQQLKNLGVAAAKGQDYSPLEIRQISELIPHPGVAAAFGFGETIGDIALMGSLQRAAGQGVFRKTLETVGDKLLKAGYEKEKIEEVLSGLYRAGSGAHLSPESEVPRFLNAQEFQPKSPMGRRIAGTPEPGAPPVPPAGPDAPTVPPPTGPAVPSAPRQTVPAAPAEPPILARGGAPGPIPHPAPIMPQNPPSDALMDAMVRKHGENAAFFIPGPGAQAGTLRMTIAAKKLSDLFDLTPSAVTDAMTGAVRTHSEAMQGGGDAGMASQAASKAFWGALPIRQALVNMGLGSDNAFLEKFVYTLQQGDPAASAQIFNSVIASDPELASIFPPVPEPAPLPPAPKYAVEGKPVSDKEASELVKPRNSKGPTSLAQFVRRSGGVNPNLPGSSDIREIGRIELLNTRGGKSLDQMVESAIEAGYLPRGSTGSDLTQLLDQEIKTGQKVYPQEKSMRAEPMAQAEPPARVEPEYPAEWDAAEKGGEYSGFSRQVDNFMGGKMGRGEVFRVASETPEVMVRLGAPQLPISMSQNVARKVIFEKHGIQPEDIKKIPSLIADPVMVFNSASRPDSMVVLTEIRHGEKSVVVAIHLARAEQRHQVNSISSIHGKDRDSAILRWINGGLLRYVNTKKATAWSQSAGLQLPGEATTPSTYSILSEHDFVNGSGESFAEGSRAPVATDQPRRPPEAFQKKPEQLELPTEAQLSKPPAGTPAPPPSVAQNHITVEIREAGFMPTTKLKMDNIGDDTAAIFYHLKSEVVENFYAVLLDDGNKIIGIHHGGMGQATEVGIDPANLMRVAKKSGAKKMVLVHNHPSGNPSPSREDRKLTISINKLAKEMGVALEGHVVIDHGEYGFIAPDGLFEVRPFVEPSARPLKARLLQSAQVRSSGGVYDGRKIDNPGVAVDIAKEVLGKDNNTIFAIYMNVRNQVNAIIPIATTNSPSEAIIGPIRQGVLDHAGTRVLLTAFGKIDMALLTQVKKALRPLNAQLMDAVFPSRDFSTYESMQEQSGGSAFLEQGEGYTLREPKKEEDAAKRFLDMIDRAKKTKAKQGLIAQVKAAQVEKGLSSATLARIRKSMGVESLKTAEPDKLKALIDFIGKLEKGDSFLAESQLENLKDVLAGVERPDLTPRRLLIDKFGEKGGILEEGLLGKVSNELIPTVDIKTGHPIVERIVNQAEAAMDQAVKETERRNQEYGEMFKLARESRAKLLTPTERLRRRFAPQDREIFAALSGGNVNLTKEEAAVVARMKNFFKKVAKDLELDKTRKNYVTHMQQTLLEKLVNEGVLGAVADILKDQKRVDIPTDILVELDNIIGSEKFFKYALERKGYGRPTTNLARIMDEYGRLYETKKALDSVLPLGQTAVKLLLKGQSALWQKRFLQNLKGRGLDHDFRTGKMGWLAKVADGIVDIGYLKLLGFNYMSGVKNLIAGEVNSFIWQSAMDYIAGKKRFVENPAKAYRMARENGILEGTYVDYANQGVEFLRKARDLSMLQTKLGEIEIRTSLFLGELTPGEWESGTVTPERIRAIKDIVAITQGTFSKTETPLLLQTSLGRMFFQMNRWRVTNTMMALRVVKGAKEEFARGEYSGRNARRLGKMLFFYGLAMYIGSELEKAGYKKGSKLVRAAGENINSIVELVTTDALMKMFTDNPTFSFMKEFFFTMQELAAYAGVPAIRAPQKVKYQRGLEDTHIAPVKTARELLGYEDKKPSKGGPFGSRGGGFKKSESGASQWR